MYSTEIVNALFSEMDTYFLQASRLPNSRDKSEFAFWEEGSQCFVAMYRKQYSLNFQPRAAHIRMPPSKYGERPDEGAVEEFRASLKSYCSLYNAHKKLEFGTRSFLTRKRSTKMIALQKQRHFFHASGLWKNCSIR